jgi:cell division protease FtsH
MVTEYGFSDKLGRLRYTDNDEEVFLGHSVARHKNVSDATAKLIDEEVRRLIEEAETTAQTVLMEKAADLETLAQALLEYETLSGSEVDSLLSGGGIVRPDLKEDNSDSNTKTSVPSSGSGVEKDTDEGYTGNLTPEPQPEG